MLVLCEMLYYGDMSFSRQGLAATGVRQADPSLAIKVSFCLLSF